MRMSGLLGTSIGCTAGAGFALSSHAVYARSRRKLAPEARRLQTNFLASASERSFECARKSGDRHPRQSAGFDHMIKDRSPGGIQIPRGFVHVRQHVGFRDLDQIDVSRFKPSMDFRLALSLWIALPIHRDAWSCAEHRGIGDVVPTIHIERNVVAQIEFSPGRRRRETEANSYAYMPAMFCTATFGPFPSAR